MQVLKSFPAAAAVLRRAAGLILHKPDIKIEAETIGSDYGAHTIPTGVLTPSSIIYSFGIGNDVSFDLGVIGRYGCTVHGFDPTPRSVAWVAGNVSEPRFVFHQLGIGAVDGEDSFEPPKQETHVSYFPTTGTAGAYRFKVNRLATIMKDLGHGGLDVLKMDVEGFEYAVLADMIASKVRPRTIAVEFHHRMYGIAEAETIAAVRDLRRNGYRLFHVSDTGREYSFIDGELAHPA